MEILIKNGLIVDGSGNEPYVGDVLIEGERIKSVGKTVKNTAEKTIDASQMVVCPGFIDTHSHSDLKILENPFNEIKIRQGITTELLGQDGISMAPLPKEFIKPWRKNLAGLDGESDSIDWGYETTDNYLKMMQERGVGLNQSYLVPHGNVRMEAMGLENRLSTDEETKRMVEITRREMEAGALGLSTGLIYIPCAYSNTNELIEMCKVVAEYDGAFVVHQRSEADTIIDSMKEVIEIGRKSGVKIHFSHFKICGKNNWKYIDEVEKLLDDAKAEGLAVSFDQYPYIAGSTMLGVILPPWAHSGGTDKLLERLESKEERAKMKHDMLNGIPGWDNFVDFAGLDQIFITSVRTQKNEGFIGKSLIELGQLQGKDPFEATFDLLLEEENAVGMVDFYGKEDHVVRFMKREEQNLCTDGLLAGKPHPRVYGSFPRFLGKYVRDEKHIELKDAIYKMTKKPASVFNYKERGELKEGYFADIVVFDPERIIDKGDFVNPDINPVGIRDVMINGKFVMEDEKYDKVLAGKVIRR